MSSIRECIPPLIAAGISHDDALALRRASITLQRWFELECGDGNDHASWTVARGYKTKRTHTRDPESQASIWVGGEFVYDDNGKPFLEYHAHSENKARYTPLPDRETGARKRIAKILARYPGFSAYIQTDPRGCALYLLPPGSVPEGADVSSLYSSRGLAVYR